MDDKQLSSTIVEQLLSLPEQVRQAEILMSDLAQDLREKKRVLAEFEIEAQINATVDGKNAEQRKLQLDQAVMNDSNVQAYQGAITGLERQYAAAEVDYNGLHRTWKSVMALADMQASKIRWLSTFERKPQ